MKRIILILALIYNLTFVIENCSSQWSQVNLPMSGQIVKVQFVNQNTGWLLLKNSTIYTLLKTSNGGINWSPVYADSMKIMTFQFVNDSVGYGMGRAYIYDMLSKTTNGGLNWTVMQSTSSYIFDGFYFVSQDTGWVNAWNFSAYNFRTTNGLQSIELISSGSGGTPCEIKIFPFQYNGQYCGYMGSNGYLWKTTNSGYNWTQLSFSEAGSVNSFSFLNKDTGFVVYNPNLGNNTKILFTSNAGLNWIQRYYYNINYGLGYIQAVNNEKIWCGGDYMLKSTDGGIIWGRQNCQIIYPSGIYMLDTTIGFTWNGYSVNNFARTTNGGGPIVSVKNIAENLPDNYKLSQNYPNPFNQSTIINLQTSIAGNIKITVYDITGKEIQSLMNERKERGSYSIRFDSGKLSSGIYFYSLFVNDKIVETRKMLMIK